MITESDAKGLHGAQTPARNQTKRKGKEQGRLVSIAHLLSGNAANALVIAVCTALAARALGPSSYGTLALVLTIGGICERLLRFESWQPLIRYAAQPEIERDPHRMSELMLYGLLLDVVSAVLAAALSILAGWLLMPWLHLEMRHLPLVAIYAVAVAVNIRGMPTAVFRLNGEFGTLAYIQLFASALRVVLSVAALLLGLGLTAFLVIWSGTQALDSLIFLGLSFGSLKRLGLPNPLRQSWRGLTGKFPGFLRFATSTNLSSSLRTLTQEADTLLVGSYAGKQAAGFYFLAKRFAKVAQQAGQMIQAVIYPDMAKLWARGEFREFRAMTARLQMILAVIGLAILAATATIGRWLFPIVFGKAFQDAYPLLLVQLVAVVLIMHAAPSRSALLAMNRPRTVLATALVSTLLFFAICWFGLPRYGAMGANLAHVGFAGLTALVMDIVWWRGSRRDVLPRPATAGA